MSSAAENVLLQYVMPIIGVILAIGVVASPTRTVWRTRKKADIGGKPPGGGGMKGMGIRPSRHLLVMSSSSPQVAEPNCPCSPDNPARLLTPADFNPLPTVVSRPAPGCCMPCGLQAGC